MKYMTTNFHEYVKSSQTPHKPCFNPESIKNAMMEKDIINRLGITTSQQLINKIIELNKFYHNISSTTFRKWGIKNISLILEKIDNMITKFY